MFKKIIIYLVILLTWFIGFTFFPIDISYYNTLKHPLFDLNFNLFYLFSIISYIFISYSFIKVLLNNEKITNYTYHYILTFIFAQVFPLFFFFLENLWVSALVYFLYLYNLMLIYKEVKNYNEKTNITLIPIILETIFYLLYFIFLVVIN